MIKTIRVGSAAVFIILAALVALTIYVRGDKSVLTPGSPHLQQIELHRGRFLKKEKAPEFAPQPIPPVWMDPVLPRPQLPQPGAWMEREADNKYPPKGCVRD